MIPHGLPQELTNHLLKQVDVQILIAEAGVLDLKAALPNCKSLKQVILVAKGDNKDMDWSSTPVPKGVSVSTWDDLISSSKATSETPTIDKDAPKPKPLSTFHLNATTGEMDLTEFTSDVRNPSHHPLNPPLTTPQNIISGIAALLTSLPRTKPLTSTDTLLPTTPLTHPYTLTWTLAALFSNASIALNSVSGPTVDLFAATAGFKPTLLVTSPGTLTKFLTNYSRTGLGPSRFAKFFQRRSLNAGVMPSRKPMPDLNGKDAVFLVMELQALSNVRGLFVGQEVGSEQVLKSSELDELRTELGVRIGYALTSGKVAGAVAQTNLADYRNKGEVVCFGPPVGSVEIKLVGEDDVVVGAKGGQGMVSNLSLLGLVLLRCFGRSLLTYLCVIGCCQGPGSCRRKW